MWTPFTVTLQVIQASLQLGERQFWWFRLTLSEKNNERNFFKKFFTSGKNQCNNLNKYSAYSKGGKRYPMENVHSLHWLILDSFVN